MTIATALALPADFPERNLLLSVAFAVTLGTLLIQGLTLRPLIRMLSLREDNIVDDEVRRARIETADAAIKFLNRETGDGVHDMREELRLEKHIAGAAEDGDGRPVLSSKAIRARMLVVRRERLIALRREGVIGDDAFHRLEEELDLSELAVATRT